MFVDVVIGVVLASPNCLQIPVVVVVVPSPERQAEGRRWLLVA
jgi:hypothetical protein